MKKLIALMMCAMLLLSGCAAVTPDGPGVGFQLRDLMISTGEGEPVDLTGLSLNIETAQTETSTGVCVRLQADGGADARLVAGIVGQHLYLSLTGTEADHVFALDTLKVLNALSDAMEGISEELNGILPAIFPEDEEAPAEEAPEEEIPTLTDEEMEELMAQWEAAMAEAEDGGELDEYAPEADNGEDFASVPAMTGTDEAATAELNELLARCMTVEAKQIDGEDFTVIGLHFTADDMAELVALTDTTGLGLGALLSSTGVTYSLEGTITGNEDFSRYLIDIAPTVNTGSEDVVLHMAADAMGGDGAVTISASAEQDGQALGGFSLTAAATVTESADWLPEELGEDAVVLTDMSLERVTEALEDAFADFGAQLDAVAGGIQAG